MLIALCFVAAMVGGAAAFAAFVWWGPHTTVTVDLKVRQTWKCPRCGHEMGAATVLECISAERP